jgi:putative glycosyltransferase (TIGR04372 family)
MFQRVFIWEVLCKKEKYYCLSPLEQAWGHQAEETFWGLIGARMRGKKLVIIARKETLFRKWIEKFIKDRPSRIGNREFFELESPGMIVPHREIVGYDIFAVILDSYYLCLRIVRSLLYRLTRFDLFTVNKEPHRYAFQIPRFGYKALFNPDEKREFSLSLAKSYEWERFVFERYNICLSKEKERAGDEIKERMGIPRDAEYVCLHVRDLGFYAGSFYSVRDDYRCADIKDYRKMVESLNRRGVWVVRMGDPLMKPAPFISDKFIDYPFSPYKSELMDLYLMEHCKFFVGTDSGPNAVAWMFQKNIVFVNLTDWTEAIPIFHGNLSLLKYYYSISRERFLSIRELLEEPYYISRLFSPSRSNYDYIVVENSEEEIDVVVEEMLNQDADYKYTDLQDEFVRKRRVLYESWITTDPFFKENIWNFYRSSSRLTNQGTLGREFLRQNWEYGDHLKKMTADFKKAGLRR